MKVLAPWIIYSSIFKELIIAWLQKLNINIFVFLLYIHCVLIEICVWWSLNLYKKAGLIITQPPLLALYLKCVYISPRWLLVQSMCNIVNCMLNPSNVDNFESPPNLSSSFPSHDKIDLRAGLLWNINIIRFYSSGIMRSPVEKDFCFKHSEILIGASFSGGSHFIGWGHWKTKQWQSWWYSNFKLFCKANSKKHFLRLFVSCCCYLSNWAPYNNLAASTLCEFAKYGSSPAVNLCPTMLILLLSLLKWLPMTIVVQQIKPTDKQYLSCGPRKLALLLL